MKNTNEINTFWKLISEYNIIIPKLQRDYAQGRTHEPAVEQIRASLINELYSHLRENTSLELNFIYGKTDDDAIFTPIDGQQRLTTLFLLHWYIFSRCSYTDGIELLKKFSYDTRDTSRRFCKHLCESTISFDQEKLSKSIKEYHWYTGSFTGDPTVDSMMVMLDAIHTRFKSESDFEVLKNRLISAECPITFLWLEMENFQNPADLYIKMNARGKLLSDFEIFKAKLQNSVLLSMLLGPDCDESQKVTYISKYNNQHAEFFYRVFGDVFDAAMMDFIKSVVRDCYFCRIAQNKVSQKQYRDEYTKVRDMNGNVFFSYLENNGLNVLDGEELSIFVDSISQVDRLLEMFTRNSFAFINEPSLCKEYYNEKTLFISNYRSQGFSENIVRFAIYSYLLKFDIPSNDDEVFAYSLWKRFIYNIVENITWGGHVEYVCQALSCFANILCKITQPSKESVLATIAGINKEEYEGFLQRCLEEEITKASLMQPANESNPWFTAIVKAEEYFDDGQIGFLLHMCWDQNIKCYDLSAFQQFFTLSQDLLTNKKQLSNTIDATLFEQALLCMPDRTETKTAHLQKQAWSSTSWGFLRHDFSGFLSNAADKEQMDIFKSLMNVLREVDDYNTNLAAIVNDFDISTLDEQEHWKGTFVKNNLFSIPLGNYIFRNCIHLSEDKREVLLLTRTTVRAYSMEINTFLLYQEIKAMFQEDVSLKLSKTGSLYEMDGFPSRYIDCAPYKIGYKCEDGIFIVRKHGHDELLTKEQVLELIYGAH